MHRDSFVDRADELRDKPDLWLEVEKNLRAAVEDAVQHVKWFAMDFDDYTGPGMRDALIAKYRAGEREHNRAWLNMTPSEFDREIREEVQDLILYLAMRKTRWQLQRDFADAYTTDADPGDEQSDDDFGVAV